MWLDVLNGFNRESDSVTVGAMVGCHVTPMRRGVSIAKAIPSLLEHESLLQLRISL